MQIDGRWWTVDRRIHHPVWIVERAHQALHTYLHGLIRTTFTLQNTEAPCTTHPSPPSVDDLGACDLLRCG